MRKVTNGVTDKAREEFWPNLPDPFELLKNGNPMHLQVSRAPEKDRGQGQLSTHFFWALVVG
jgi:hypothetical protein